MSLSALPIFVQVKGRAVMLVGEGEAGEAKRRLLERAGATIVGEEGQAAIAIVALADPEPVAERLRARGMLINVADRPELCDFFLPAIVERDPVVVAIGTAGASAGLAAALRQRIEAWLPARLGDLARALTLSRGRIRTRWPEGDARRRAVATALSPGGMLDPLREHQPEAVELWLKAPEPEGPEDRLVRLSLASADPDDLTLRAARLLAAADRIFHREDVPPAILNRTRADAPRIACAAPPLEPGPGLSVDLEMRR